MSGTDQGDDHRDGADVTVKLVLQPGERVHGRLHTPGNAGSAAFDGWIDLMGAINSLREEFGLTGLSSPAPDPTPSVSTTSMTLNIKGFPDANTNSAS